MTTTQTCTDCGAAIIWATNDQGKRFALNANPSREGQWFLGAGLRAQHAGNPSPDHPRIAYRAHFATCPRTRHRQQPWLINPTGRTLR